MASSSLLDSRAGLLDTLLPAFVLELVQGDLTPGERELAYNLTVIYGLSLLSMVVCYRLLRPLLSPPAQESPAALEPSLPCLASTLALVKARRSVTPKDLNGSPLAREEVEAMLEAANWAPTHHRNEPWRFTVLQGSQAIAGYLDRLDQWYSEHREEMGQEEYTKFLAKLEGSRTSWVHQASHVVVLGMVRQAKANRAAEWEEIAAVGCAVQNLHLALTAIPGAGGFWSSHTWCRRARDSQEWREYLGLGDLEDRVLGAFVMGRTSKELKGRREDWRDKCTWEE